MKAPPLLVARYAIRRQCGLWLSRLRLNRLQPILEERQARFFRRAADGFLPSVVDSARNRSRKGNSGEFHYGNFSPAACLKSRRWWSRLVIPIGNWYMRRIGADSEVLSQPAWTAWEQAIAARKFELQTNCVMTLGELPAASSGIVLSTYLGQAEVAATDKLQAVSLALIALRQLHRICGVWPNDLAKTLSHGDATVGNVCIDNERQTATWFDFDTRHCPHVSQLDRECDDFRALTFSAAICLPQTYHEQLADRSVEIVGGEVSARFKELLSTDWSLPNVFQLAQAPLQLGDYNALRQTWSAAIHRRFGK
ncbi:MAG: hypothetical protein R3C53_00625 [Pirellulaceae bacterium]